VGLGPGETFERYEIEERIGRGGMGEVYRALDTRLLRKVAIKVIRPDRTDWEEAIARLFREARAAAAFQHPNAVAIYDLGQVEGTFFIVMELVRGRTLRGYVGPGTAPLDMKLRWLVGIARALSAAHEAGIVHRDVKPGNIMITSEGVAKVLDFGLAKPIDDTESVTKVGYLLGTPRYMSPEQREGTEADARSDQYAYGLTAYELLTGTHAETRADGVAGLTRLVPGLTVPMAQVIERTLQDDPARRYPSMVAAANALEMASGVPMTASTRLRSSSSRAPARTASEAPSTEQRLLMPRIPRLIGDSGSSIVSSKRPGRGPLVMESPFQSSSSSSSGSIPPDPPSTIAPPELRRSSSTRPPNQVPTLSPSDVISEPPTEGVEETLRLQAHGAVAIAMALGDQFGEGLGEARYTVALTPLPGPPGQTKRDSTAFQLRLVPGDPRHAELEVGLVIPATGSAELRTYDYVGMLHASMYGRGPAVNRATYENFLTTLKTVLKTNGVESYTLVAPPYELVQLMRR
jgi:serine/threonine protein kinase